MKRGAINTLQLIVIITAIGIVLAAAIINTVHSIGNTSEITINVENGLVSKPLN